MQHLMAEVPGQTPVKTNPEQADGLWHFPPITGSQPSVPRKQLMSGENK